MKTFLSMFLLCLTLLPAVPLQAAAAENVQQGFMPPAAERERSPEREPRISQNQASAIARENVPGSRVLNIRRDEQNWRVRVDQEGNVSDVLVNTESGRVSRSGDE
ncbi:MAG: PepSY domain-containing protein [Pseudomonadota bacterium]|nr:PepSY domain-containing protein [Pseudomonadota bacterium]